MQFGSVFRSSSTLAPAAQPRMPQWLGLWHPRSTVRSDSEPLRTLAIMAVRLRCSRCPKSGIMRPCKPSHPSPPRLTAHGVNAILPFHFTLRA